MSYEDTKKEIRQLIPNQKRGQISANDIYQSFEKALNAIPDINLGVNTIEVSVRNWIKGVTSSETLNVNTNTLYSSYYITTRVRLIPSTLHSISYAGFGVFSSTYNNYMIITLDSENNVVRSIELTPDVQSGIIVFNENEVAYVYNTANDLLDPVKALRNSLVETYTFKYKDVFNDEYNVRDNYLSGGDYTGFVLPRRIYTVLNDIDSTLIDGNYSAAMYLDHFILNVRKELNSRFLSSNDDKITFNSESYHEFNSPYSLVLNKDKDVYEEDFEDAIVVDNEVKQTFTVKQISTLNSASKSSKISYMIIGDSVSYGKSANLSSGDSEERDWRFSAIIEELFLRDRILNSSEIGEEYQAKSIGIHKISRTVSIDGSDHTFNNFVTAVQGATTEFMLLNYFDDGSGNWSMSSFLNKYRTMDDEGNRLYTDNIGSTSKASSSQLQGYYDNGSVATGYMVGSLVTDTNDYDVYKPTHIIIATGLNDINLSVNDWYSGFYNAVTDFKTDYSTQAWAEPLIGVIIMDSSGTISPSKHNLIYKYSEFGIMNDSRRKWMAQFIQKWMDENSDANEETSKTWLIPVYWSFPCGDSTSFRSVNLPSALASSESKYKINVGNTPMPQTHINAIGHSNIAYQIYAWMKYSVVI